MTWGWVNYQDILIWKWTNPLSILKKHVILIPNTVLDAVDCGVYVGRITMQASGVFDLKQCCAESLCDIMGVMHSLFLRGHEWGVGGVGRVSRHVTHSSHNSILFYLVISFIGNIPKHINYIMKYLDSHIYRLLVDLVGDGQSSLIM